MFVNIITAAWWVQRRRAPSPKSDFTSKQAGLLIPPCVGGHKGPTAALLCGALCRFICGHLKGHSSLTQPLFDNSRDNTRPCFIYQSRLSDSSRVFLRKILVNALYQLMAVTHQGVTVAPTLHTGASNQQGPTVRFPLGVLHVYSDSQ